VDVPYLYFIWLDDCCSLSLSKQEVFNKEEMWWWIMWTMQRNGNAW